MIFWFKYALRSSLRRTKRTIITIFGIAFGIAIMIFLSSIMVGVNDTMILNAIMPLSGHLKISSIPQTQNNAQERYSFWQEYNGINIIDLIIPRISLFTVLDNNFPIKIIFSDPMKESEKTAAFQRIENGEVSKNSDEIMIGEKLAKKLGIDTGDYLQCEENKWQVSGIFKTGIEEIDLIFAYCPIAGLDKINDQISVSSEEIVYLKNPDAAVKAERILSEILSENEKITLWYDANPAIKQLTDLNAFSMLIVMFLVVCMMGFAISNTVLISVMDRYKTFGILKAIGVRPGGIFSLVFIETFLMCVSAGVVGTIMGIGVTTLFLRTGIDFSRFTSENPNFFFSSMVYPRLTLKMVLLPQIFAYLAGLVACLYPASKAAWRRTNETLRDFR